ncbi:hypothetical protein Q7P37_005210 [Cladosporium fusiforme]
MSRTSRLAPEVNRALFVKNLNYAVSTEELFDLFGQFGPIRYALPIAPGHPAHEPTDHPHQPDHLLTSDSRQIRQGIANNTKGSAYVVYEDVNDAKSACDRLNGFNFQSRYLVVLYHQPEKMSKAAAAAASSQDLAARAENLERLKQEHAIIDFGDIAGPGTGNITTTTTTPAKATEEEHGTSTPVVSVREGHVTISATPANITAGGHMSYWRRVKDKAFGKVHVRCGKA